MRRLLTNFDVDNWQRLEQVIKWTGLSINSFAQGIGLRRAENLYQIKKGNNGISSTLAELIYTKYPSISKGWLLSGEGGMFIDQAKFCPCNGIPCYGIDAVSTVTTPPEALSKPIYHITIPSFADSTLAANNISNAMSPEIPAGAVVVLKKTEIESVSPGETYLIISEKFKGIRKVRYSSDPNVFMLIPGNSKDFDATTLKKNTIEQLFLVTGVIITKTST